MSSASPPLSNQDAAGQDAAGLNAAGLDEFWDVVVVGAGPAGGAVSVALASRGLRTLLVERKAFPRPKVCGGCLNPRSLSALESLGLNLPHSAWCAPVDSLELWAGGRRARVPLPGGAVVDRAAFDGWLVQQATARGAVFIDQTTAEIGPVIGDAREVRLTSSDRTSPGQRAPGQRTLRARMVVAADGLAGSSHHALGGSRQVAESSHLGAGAVLTACPGEALPGTVGMHVGRHGYVGIAPVNATQWNVAAALAPSWVRECGDLAAAVQATLTEARGSQLAAPLAGEILAAEWHGAPLLTARPARVAAERLMLVGDATGYVEPFTGEGMAWGILAAAAAAPLAAAGVRDWSPDLPARWTQLQARIVRRGWCTSLAWLLRRRWFVQGAIRVLGVAPWLARPVVRGVHDLHSPLAESAS